MKYNFKHDLETIKELTHISDLDICKAIGISKTSFYRYIKNNIEPNSRILESFYSYFYDMGIRLNLVNEELYKSSQDKNTLILLHGSRSGIEGDLSISYGNEKRDFGRGFYLGESAKQAISFVSSFESSSLYFVKVKNIQDLKVVEFNVSNEWMILVAYYRGKIDEYKNSKYLQSLIKKVESADIIIAPIADNSMYDIINEFIEGSITDLQCVNSLSANRLGKQYVIKNDNVLKNNVEILYKSYLCFDEKKDYQSEKEMEKSVGKSKMILAKREYAGKGKYIEMILE